MYLPIVIRSQPGIKRDGTVFEGDNYIDGQWCRFYRGLPRKMGGYRSLEKYLPEIGRGLFSYTQTAITYIFVGSANKLSYFYIDATGAPSVIVDRTPTTLAKNASNLWTFDVIVDGSQVPPVNQIVAQVAPNIDCLCNAYGGQVFIGPLIGTSPLVEITGLATNYVSATGGALSINPYLFVFGSDGSIGWSAPSRPTVFNSTEIAYYAITAVLKSAVATGDLSFAVTGSLSNNLTSVFTAGYQFAFAQNGKIYSAAGSVYVPLVAGVGDFTVVFLQGPVAANYPANTTLYGITETLTGAGNARVATQKIVKGLPLRGGGGNSPAALLWSADAVLRAQFTGGELVFQFDTISSDSSILSADSVIEQDGVYYWIGTSRFLQFNGVVRELPNPTNLNWFFDNVNTNYATKIFAFRIPRFGEIWWCFPFGNSTECNWAIIYNIREQTWYDTPLPNGGRSCGMFATVEAYPLLCGTAQTDFFEKISKTTAASSAGVSYITVSGDWHIVTAGTKITFRNNTGLDYQTVSSSSYNVVTNTTQINFTVALLYPVAKDNYVYIYTTGFNLWEHEYGVNEYGQDYQLPVLSYFETSNISLTTQNPPKNKVLSVSMMEPDFAQVGDMSVQITGQANARSVVEVSEELTIYETPTDAHEQVVNFKTERRILRFKFKSNVIDGNYQMGQVLAHVEESDGRYLGGVK